MSMMSRFCSENKWTSVRAEGFALVPTRPTRKDSGGAAGHDVPRPHSFRICCLRGTRPCVLRLTQGECFPHNQPNGARVGLKKLESVDRWQIFAANIRDYAFILMDSNNRVADWNPGAQEVLGYEREEILGQPADVFFTPEDREAGIPGKEIAIALAHGRAEDERWHIRKDGSRFRASGILTSLRDQSSNLLGFAKVMQDVTAREKAREQLERSLRERTALIREVHHRVKNNLQMIMSLIRLQADRLNDAPSKLAFEETEARVRTISTVHERLYASADFAIVHVAPYLRTLARDVKNSLDDDDLITVNIDIADLALEIGEAVPLALITNELMQNAFKHAFPEGNGGEITLKLVYDSQEGEATRAELEIRDNGVGLPAGVTFEKYDSLGFDLVRILATQLHGEVRAESGSSGVCFRLSFPLAA
jgi:PAS domain S-box-containing protein